MEFIKQHKKACIIIAIVLFLFIVFVLFVRKLSPDAHKNLYGNRLDGIEKVKINEDRMKSLETDLKKEEGIKSVSYDLKGRLVNLVVEVDQSLSKEKAKTYANKTLEYFDDDEKKYYDIQIFFMTKENSEIYPIIGYKHKTSNTYVFKQE